VQTDYENRIARDDRSRLITTSMNEKLRKKYTVKKDNKAYTAAVKALNDDIYVKAWVIPANTEPYNVTILTINNDRQVTAKEFLEYINIQQKTGFTAKPVSKQADILFTQFTDDQLTKYHNDNLEREYPEFGMVMQEYRDGLLLYDLMEKEIWEKAKIDTVGLENFYRKNIGNYQWKDRIDAEIYSSTDEDIIKKTRKYLRKGENAEFIKKQVEYS
jgi:peptidyl-prolyl cis-trans isomerase SurA